MYNKNIALLRDENWFGGQVSDGINMPYKDGFKGCLLNTSTENQTMPLLLSDKGRFIWSEDPFSYEFSANELILSSSFSEIYLYEGFADLKGAYLEACNKFFKFDEKTPNEMLFKKPQYNTWIELMYNQTEENILNYANDIIKEGYPTGVLMIDDNWQEDYGIFKFHEGRFNNPKEMIKKLHSMGFLVMLWVSPFVSPDSQTYRALSKKGYFIKNADGNDYMCKWWNGYSALLDCTNPEAVLWLQSELDYLMKEYGVDGFKLDAGDRFFYNETLVSNVNVNPQEHCKAYAMLGLKYDLSEYRASYKMGGKALAQRLCDKQHSWDNSGLGSLIPNALAQGLMGYAYNCPDMIGGGQYENFLPENLNIDEELVVRYAQCSAMFPMMQYSVAPFRVLSEGNAKICLDMAKLHTDFGDIIYKLAKDVAVTSEPIMRSMAYEFSDEYSHISNQFLLGDKILVAPVTTKATYEREVVLPKGVWRSDRDECFNGPITIKTDVPIERLPYFIKED